MRAGSPYLIPIRNTSPFRDPHTFVRAELQLHLRPL